MWPSTHTETFHITENSVLHLSKVDTFETAEFALRCDKKSSLLKALMYDYHLVLINIRWPQMNDKGHQVNLSN